MAAAQDHIVAFGGEKRRKQQDQKSHRSFILHSPEFATHPPALRWYLK
jgi:hypothetical protein